MKHDSTTTVWDKYSCSKGWQFQLTKAAKIVALASALMLFFPIITHAQNSITVTIKDKATGDPLAGVHVSVGQQVATTNSQGFYVLKNLKPGTHIVTASLVGYKSEQQPAKIVNESITLNFFLEEDLIFLNEVTVSATRTESRIADIPGRIEMITPEKISLASYQSVDELLTLIPGVHTARSFGLFSYRSSVSMRGVSSKEQGRTLVLLDGIPMNKADGGSVNWNLISTREIERIEVVKGPGSALYGGNAMGGIINVVTQKPTRPLEGSVAGSYGTYNTKGVNAKLAGKLNNGFYWAADGLFRNSDGYITQSIADRLTNPYIVKSTFEEKVLHLRTGYDNGQKLQADVDFTLFDDVRTTGEKVYQPQGNTREYDTYQLRANVKGVAGAVVWNVSAFFLNEDYKRVSEWMKDDYTWYDVLSVRRDYGLLTSANYRAGRHTFTGGVDLRMGSVDASDVYYTSTDRVDNNGKMNFYGFYLQDVVALFDSTVNVTAGLRYDYARFFDGQFQILSPSAETAFMSQYQFSQNGSESWGALSPRISAQFKPNGNYRIYASYSRGFRPSVLDDLCRSGRVKGGFKVANPNLKPEYLDNFEVGGDYKPFDRLRLAASAYYSTGKDFLYYVSTGDSIDMGFGPRPIMIPSNISDVEIYGMEAEFSATPWRFLTLSGGYAYALSKITGYKPIAANDFDLTGKYLTDVPKHSFNAGAFLRSHIVNAGVTANYTGRMYINDQNAYDDIVLSNQLPAAFTLDLKISREFFGHVNISLNIQNILDKKIYESSMSVGPGRFMMLEVKANL